MRKLSEGEVRSKRCLSALFANETNPDVSGQNHRHVIASVADGGHAHAGVLLQEAHNGGLLVGRTPTHDDSRALAGQLDELVLVIFQADLSQENLDSRSKQ